MVCGQLGNSLFIFFFISGDRLVSSILCSPTILAKYYHHLIANRNSIITSLELDSLRNHMLSIPFLSL